MSSRIFISHSSRDKLVADRFREFFLLAGVPKGSIFYTSARSTGVSTGEKFGEIIRTELAEAALVVPLISQHFLQSPYCLAELGGQWALQIPVFPIAVPPLEVKDVGGVLAGVHAASLDDPESLEELQVRIQAILGIDTLQDWGAQQRAFLATLPQLLRSLQPAQPLLVGKPVGPQDLLSRIQAARQKWINDPRVSRFDDPFFKEAREEAVEPSVVASMNSDQRAWLLQGCLYNGTVPSPLLPDRNADWAVDPCAYWLEQIGFRTPRYRAALVLEHLSDRVKRIVISRCKDADYISEDFARAIKTKSVIHFVSDPKLAPEMHGGQDEENRRRHLIQFSEYLEQVYQSR